MLKSPSNLNFARASVPLGECANAVPPVLTCSCQNIRGQGSSWGDPEQRSCRSSAPPTVLPCYLVTFQVMVQVIAGPGIRLKEELLLVLGEVSVVPYRVLCLVRIAGDLFHGFPDQDRVTLSCARRFWGHDMWWCLRVDWKEERDVYSSRGHQLESCPSIHYCQVRSNLPSRMHGHVRKH